MRRAVNLYGRYVTDFPHVKKLFTESYARLIGMKLFAFTGRGLYAQRF